MYRDLLDQVSPIVGAEVGDAVGHGFDFRNEVFNLLVVPLSSIVPNLSP